MGIRGSFRRTLPRKNGQEPVPEGTGLPVGMDGSLSGRGAARSRCSFKRNSGWSKPTSSPSDTSTSVITPSAGEGTSLIIFMASRMHTVCPFLTTAPTGAKGSASGEAAA